MTEKLPGWDPVAAGRATGHTEKNQVIGTKYSRPQWWYPGMGVSKGAPTREQSRASHRSTRRTNQAKALERKLNGLLGKLPGRGEE